MSIETPLPPWKLPCPWCDFVLTVFGRGARGGNQGAGVEAAERMRDHVERWHGRTWREFLSEPKKEKVV